MFYHVGRLTMSREFLKGLADPLKQQAYSTAMSSFVVIEARMDILSDTLEQVIFDPSGQRLSAIVDADVVPLYDMVITKQKPLSIFENPYTIELRQKS